VAIFNALIATIMFEGRLFFSLGRDEIFHPTINATLARVHRSSGAPRLATWVVGVISAACCLLDTHVLVVFISGLTVYSLGLVSVAVLVGRKRLLTGQPGYWRSPLFPLAPVLGLILAVAFGVADLLDADAGRPSLLVLGAMIIAGLLWHHFVLRRRTTENDDIRGDSIRKAPAAHLILVERNAHAPASRPRRQALYPALRQAWGSFRVHGAHLYMAAVRQARPPLAPRMSHSGPVPPVR
jgi:amino acid transporter